MLSFRRRRPEPDRAHADGLKPRIAAHLGLGPEDALTISEIACGDPACPGRETVILVMRRGRRTVALRIARPLAEIEGEDVEALGLEEGA